MKSVFTTILFLIFVYHGPSWNIGPCSFEQEEQPAHHLGLIHDRLSNETENQRVHHFGLIHDRLIHETQELYEIAGQKVNKSCECGVSSISSKNRRIVGGTTVQPHQYPWLVALMLGSKLHCGGAIITDRHILSAGHCIAFGVSYTDLTVSVGMHDRFNGNHQAFSICSGVKHPAFTSNAVRDINDIAVLKLDDKIRFSDLVRPICLPDEHLTFDDIELTVAGWGKVRQGAATSSRYLLETSVKIIDSTKCMKSAIYSNNLEKSTMLCAYALGKDACQGDSGGPLFATHPKTGDRKWYQVGVVSWGIDCAMPDYPGVYTIVNKYIKWIKSVTADGVYCV